MTSGADLFVVCKQCGSEVSPYVTECPYCGNRLRRRAPKLPRVHGPSTPQRARGPLRALLGGRSGASSQARRGRSSSLSSAWAGTRPYATISLVAIGALAWVACRVEPSIYGHTAIVGPLAGDWWKLATSQLVYLFNGAYVMVALVALSIFGWLFEQRHGAVTTLALFFGAGIAGALVACAVYTEPILSGAAPPALALLAAWAAPDLRAARAGDYYEGDLLGAAAVAALLVGMGFAFYVPEANWLAEVVAGAIGLLTGLGLQAGAADA
jgi:hypothetical protein